MIIAYHHDYTFIFEPGIKILFPDLAMSKKSSLRTRHYSRKISRTLLCDDESDLGFGMILDSPSKKDAGSIRKDNDRMTELIDLQRSNGIFEISSSNWIDSVFELHTGMSYDDIQSSCPAGVAFNLWITALAIKIMELKMTAQKELWELVVEKGKKSLTIELENNKEMYEMLLNKAEERIKRK